jgi:ankyrin repeat protein
MTEKPSSLEIVRYFVENGGLHLTTFTDKVSLEFVLFAIIDLNICFYQSRDTALMYAARAGDYDVVKFLLLLAREHQGTPVDEPNKVRVYLSRFDRLSD